LSPVLAITIPTFNRSKALENTLATIMPQLSQMVECIVLDNASTDATSQVLSNAERACPFVHVIRHPCNIGGNANFLRCFEVARARWLWILPDDDVPYPDAVTRILSVIEEHPDAGYLNFATSLLNAVKVCRKESTTTRGLTPYIWSLDSFSQLLFLTAGVYRRAPMLDGMPVAARMANTYGPHLALLLLALRRDPSLEVIQSHVSIADWRGPAQWDAEQLTRGIYGLLSLIPDRADRTRFCKLIETEVPPFLTRRNWASDVVACAADKDDDVLRNAIQRYSTIAALTGRFRTAALVGMLVDACSWLGSRRICRAIESARYVIRKGRRPDASIAMAKAVCAAERKM